MARKVLLGVLALAFVWELTMTVAGFCCPTMVLAKMGIAADAGTLFLGHVVAWFLLLITVMIGFALRDVRRGHPNGWAMTRLLSLWWLPLGISIFVFFGRPDNLFTDSLKGLILLVAAHYSAPRRK